MTIPDFFYLRWVDEGFSVFFDTWGSWGIFHEKLQGFQMISSEIGWVGPEKGTRSS